MRSRWNFLGAALVTSVVSVVACGGDAERTTPYERFTDDYTVAFCNALAPCCTFMAFSVDECRSLLSLFLGIQASEARAKAFVFHAEQAKQCLADLRTESICNGDAPASCDVVTEGKLSAGDACRSSVECPSSARSPGVCRLTDDNRGVCLFPGRAAARGEACAGNCDGNFDCSATEFDMAAYCYPDTGLTCTNGSCEDLAPSGAPCSGFGACVPTAACRAGTCTTLVGLGGVCASSSDCLPELYCASGACAPRLPAGSPCDGDSCLDGCVEGRCANFALETLCLFGSTE